MTSILPDTGVIVALLDRGEQYHSRCVEVLSELEGSLVTCEACIANLLSVAQYPGSGLGTGRIFTLDRDFEIYRWRARRKFELLVTL